MKIPSDSISMQLDVKCIVERIRTQQSIQWKKKNTVKLTHNR